MSEVFAFAPPREPAVRLVHKEDAPNALYPEVYRE